MNRLDLNAYGVEEMSETQTREVNGGCKVCDILDAIVECIKKIVHALT